MQYKRGRGCSRKQNAKSQKKNDRGIQKTSTKKRTEKTEKKPRRRRQAAKTPKSKSKSKADDPKSVYHHILPCAHYSICIHLQTGNPRACAPIPKSVTPRVPKESRGRPLDMCMFFVWLPRFLYLVAIVGQRDREYKKDIEPSYR